MKLLNKDRAHRLLLRQIKSAMEHPSTEMANLHKEFELHFGPSQQFKTCFIKALIYEATVTASTETSAQ